MKLEVCKFRRAISDLNVEKGLKLKAHKISRIYILNKTGEFIGKGFRTSDVQLSKQSIFPGIKIKQKENQLIRKSSVTPIGLMTKETTEVSLSQLPGTKHRKRSNKLILSTTTIII